MWELIQANKRKSIMIFMAMGICLVLLGYVIGATYNPRDGGISGIFLALGLWGFLSVISYFSGDSILLAISRAREVTHDVHPQLFNIVEEMKIASSLPAMPKIYIIDDPAPNAFATGIKPEKSAIAVTSGLLSRLNRDELQGVIAHETSHIFNRDVLFVTFTGVMLGSIVLISEIFLRSLWFSSGSRYSSREGRGGGQLQALIMIIAVVFAILAPIMARLLYFALSRRREYLADASAVRLTRYPEGLASALEKISSVDIDLQSANKVTAPMYIVNPLKKKGMQLSDLTSTHPPISERIKILRGMMQGVNYMEYQKAYSRITGESSAIIPPSGLHETETLAVRSASGEQTTLKTKQRGIGDMMMTLNKYIFLTCICGLKIKVPPEFKQPSITCPRCGRSIEVPGNK
jgi:heat shock protein HtpX